MPDSVEVIVANRGFGAAEKVLIHINATGSPITSYKVDSQELYEMRGFDAEQGVMDVWLDRLASNAQIRIDFTVGQLALDGLRVSATGDQGASVPSDRPTFSQHVRGWFASIVNLLGDAGRLVGSSPLVQSVLSKPPVAKVWQIVSADEFRTVALALFICLVLIRLFFAHGYFAIALVASVIILDRLYLKATVSTNCIVVPVALALVVVALRWLSNLSVDNLSDKISDTPAQLVRWLLGLLVVTFAACAIYWSWDARVSIYLFLLVALPLIVGLVSLVFRYAEEWSILLYLGLIVSAIAWFWYDPESIVWLAITFPVATIVLAYIFDFDVLDRISNWFKTSSQSQDRRRS
jgi:hypothetical protein